MANIYVRSTDGNDADDGSTWALAKATITGAAAIDAAGDSIYVSQAHAESTAATVTFALAGTAASPTRLICGNDAAEPPTTLANTATVTTTGTADIIITGNAVIDSITFNAGTGGGISTIRHSNTAGNRQVYRNCNFNVVSTGTGQINPTATASNTYTTWHNCYAKFSAVGQLISPGRGIFDWRGGGIASGGTSPTTLFTNPGANGSAGVIMRGVDLSIGGSAMNIMAAGSVGGRLLMANCKLPASWTGSLVTGTLNPGFRAEMHNCDSADTNYRLWIEDYAGSIKSETTLVKTGGASDGTTSYSWKMVSTASASAYASPLESCDLPARWNTTVGSAITVTVDILRDSATNLTDAEIWIELSYLGTSGYPLATFITDEKTNILTTAADQASSSATWTTTGMTNPNKQKLVVTFTPQEVGFLQARVVVCKASATIYVDPVLRVS